MTQLVECVPNFSEGRDLKVIERIISSIVSVSGIKLLDTFTGAETNRTVITFAGTPGDVVEAAYRSIETASLYIDMSKQKGLHPRMGATDVCPFIPLSGISMEDTVQYARLLAERVGNELKLPVYCYEYAAFYKERQALESIRRGGYEGLKNRLLSSVWKPDFGPAEWNEKIRKAGSVIIGARNFLIAYNINLDTDSLEIACDIAANIRESGRKRVKPISSDGLRYDNASYSGKFKKVKAIGWYLKEYNCSQVSINITDYNITPIHLVYEEVSLQAEMRGVKVTGSELVGLIPLKAILDAGKYFISKIGFEKSFSEKEIISVGAEYLGLDHAYPFDPEKKVIEYAIL